MEHVFIHDKSGTFNNLSSNTSESNDTTIIAEKGFVEGKNMFLLNGQIITSKKNQEKNEIVKFEELNINLTKLKTTTIKKIKLQETNTIKLLKCFTSIGINDNDNLCNKNAKKEILPILLRRLILPFYIPLISLICSFLLF